MRFFSFLFCLLSTIVKAQELSVFSRTLDIEKGAPTEQFYDIAKHPNQSILLASDRGIFTFNGIRFKKIPFKNHRSNSSTNILIASDGAIWCRNFSEQIFRGNELILNELNQLTKLISGENIVGIHEVEKTIYIVTNYGVYQSDLKGKHAKRLQKIVNIETSFVWKNKLFVSNVNGQLFEVNGYKNYVLATAPCPQGRFVVWRNRVYLFSRNTLNKEVYQLQGNRFRVFTTIPIPMSFSVLNTVSDTEFFGAATSQGLVLIDENGLVKWIEQGKAISDLTRDAENNFWLSSLNNGLIFIPDLSAQFLLKNDPTTTFNNLTHDQHSNLYISTNRGTVIQLNLKNLNSKIWKTNSEQNLEFVQFDSKFEKLYVSNGCFDVKKNQFSPFYFGKDISFDKEGRLFFALHSLAGFQSPYTEAKLVDKVAVNQLDLPQKGNFYSIRNQRTRTLLFSNNFGLIVGYADELINYSKTGIKNWRDEKGNAVFATDIVENSAGIWVSTTQNGVFLFDKKGKVRHHWKVNSDLSGEICKKLYSTQNKVYVVNEKGIDCIDKQHWKINYLTADLGIQNLVFNDLLISESKVYALTNKGLICFPLQSNFRKKNEQSLVLKEWLINGKSHRKSAITLRYNENSISFLWHATVFSKAGSEALEYRLYPKMKEWKKVALTTESIDFFDLQPGDYRFELRFKNFPSRSINQQFTIQKPFWFSWWFFVLLFISGFGLIYWIVRYFHYRFRKQQLFKERLVISQLTALRSQMNPHFLYNVLNSLQGLIYSKKLNEAGEYVSKFSDHLRRVLDYSSKQEISVKEEIEGLKLYLDLEKLRFGDDFKFEINKSLEVSDLLQIPSMIVQPFAENAVKHGLLNKHGEKIIQIKFVKSENNCLKISVIDNGIGRKAAEIINSKRKDKPSSFALSAIEGRINLLSQYYVSPIVFQYEDLLSSGKVEGTSVILIIPPKKDE